MSARRFGRSGLLVALLGLAFVSPGVRADNGGDDDEGGEGCHRHSDGKKCPTLSGWKDEATYQLAEIPLSEFLDENVPGLGLVDDHGINLGGIGSDLWRSDDDCPGTYWMITDRGPNGEGPRTFPIPEFTPFILKVRTKNGAIEILDAIPITARGGSKTGITGLANLDQVTEPPALNEPFFTCGGALQLDPNVNGIDCEGLVRTDDGTFWVNEEYGPSLLKINKHGRVKRRYLPTGFASFLPPEFDYPIDDSADSIPAIFGLKRKLNRGFEGLALSTNGKSLYLALQSPLANPDLAVGNESRNTRILCFDIKKEKVTAEYVYRFQFTGPLVNDDEFDTPDASLPSGGRARARDMKVSGLAMIDKHHMLVLERTDFMAKIYKVDLRTATNILGTKWDDVATAPSLETLNADGALEANGITPLAKEFIIEFDSRLGFPQKIEGLAIVDDETIAIANDNDFGVGTFAGAGCTLVDSGLRSKILVVPLAAPLK